MRVRLPVHERELSPGTRESTARLLWEACHRHPDPLAVRRAIANGADVPAAAGAAVRDRIGPLLWRALDAAEALTSLGPARSWLVEIVEVHRMEAVFLLPRALSRALPPLTDAGLEPVVLKGPAVAMRYPERGLRPMDDIDLLLPPGQHAQALKLLEDAGWRVELAAGPGRHDTMLTHEDVPSLPLELHYDVRPTFRVNSLDATALWNSRQAIDCFGIPAFGLPLPEEQVVLATHASKPPHNFCRLIWIADLAMIVGYAEETGVDVDWERVRSLADDGQCSTVVAAALELARHAGVESPPRLFRMPRARWRSDALHRLTKTEWPLTRFELSPLYLQYALTDDRWRRMRILVHMIVGGHGISQRVRRSMAAPRRLVSHLGGR